MTMLVVVAAAEEEVMVAAVGAVDTIHRGADPVNRHGVTIVASILTCTAGFMDTKLISVIS